MIEYRTGLPFEVRSETSTVKVEGHAAVFNSKTNVAGMFEERVMPGAFSEAINRDDIVFLINHEGLPLARNSSGTLILSEDERGLLTSSELDPSDPDVMRIVPKMKRQDLNKMSFGFRVEKEEWDETGDIPLRSLIQVGLVDVSIVTMPQYTDTDIALRSLQEYRSHKPTVFDMGALKRRMKMNLALIKQG